MQDIGLYHIVNFKISVARRCHVAIHFNSTVVNAHIKSKKPGQPGETMNLLSQPSVSRYLKSRSSYS